MANQRVDEFWLAAIAFILTLALTPGFASAATLVVNQTDACTQANPDVPGNYFTTIQAAVTAANEGDTIIVCPGTYNEKVDVTVDNIVIQAFSNPKPVVSAAGILTYFVFDLSGRTGVTLQGFEIRDKSRTTQQVAGIVMANTYNCQIIDTTIINITSTATGANNGAYGIYLQNSANNFFDPIEISDINATQDAAGIYLGNSTNNSFSETSVRRILGQDACGIALYQGSNNNTFATTFIEDIDPPVNNSIGIRIWSSDDNKFTDTTITDVHSDNEAAHGITVANSNRNSFTTTMITTINAPDNAWGILLTEASENRFVGTTIRDIFSSGGTYAGVHIQNGAQKNEITDGEITNCGHGIYIEEGSENRIERNMICDNMLVVDSGAHLEAEAENNSLRGNCFFNNVLQAYDNGSGNNWDGNYWQPPPGQPGDEYRIPGTAESSDNNPLGYCPLCALEVPATTPLGLLIMLTLLAAIAATTIRLKKRQ